MIRLQAMKSAVILKDPKETPNCIGFYREKGQRYYIAVKPYDGKYALIGEVLGFDTVAKVLVEENVDIKPYEEVEREADALDDKERRERVPRFNGHEFSVMI